MVQPDREFLMVQRLSFPWIPRIEMDGIVGMDELGYAIDILFIPYALYKISQYRFIIHGAHLRHVSAPGPPPDFFSPGFFRAWHRMEYRRGDALRARMVIAKTMESLSRYLPGPGVSFHENPSP